ncbi:ribosomal protein S5 domain 2-type protein [Dipodascopsis uninucleata]
MAGSPWTSSSRPSPRPSPPPLMTKPEGALVPEVHRLENIYARTELHRQYLRWNNLKERFKSIYNQEIDFIARAPGRVNIIGEHIDYSWFPVMPMATCHDFLVAVAIDKTGSEDINLANIDHSRYPSRSFKSSDFANPFFAVVQKSENRSSTPSSSSDDADPLDWSTYFLAGLKGALTFSRLTTMSDGVQGDHILRGMKILVDGDVPVCAGLSSSSAFVCASLVAVMRATHLASFELEKSFLVNCAVISERALGINSGGMDQSASVYGVQDHALYVDFRPLLSAESISVGPFRFIVANSLVKNNRAITGPDKYNVRVVETTLAAEVLSHKLNLTRLEMRDGFGGTLRGVYSQFCAKERVSDEQATEALVACVRALLPKDAYEITEIADMLGVDVEEIVRKYMTRFPVRVQLFNLRDRAIHVLEEQHRTKIFRTLLQSSYGKLKTKENQNTLELVGTQLGELMNESHESCAKYFDCSCEPLDSMVKIARGNGALGSRLTGTGWGGCTLSLVDESHVADVVNSLTQLYYAVRFPNITKEELETAIFELSPANGVILYNSRL